MASGTLYYPTFELQWLPVLLISPNYANKLIDPSWLPTDIDMESRSHAENITSCVNVLAWPSCSSQIEYPQNSHIKTDPVCGSCLHTFLWCMASWRQQGLTSYDYSNDGQAGWNFTASFQPNLCLIFNWFILDGIFYRTISVLHPFHKALYEAKGRLSKETQAFNAMIFGSKNESEFVLKVRLKPSCRCKYAYIYSWISIFIYMMFIFKINLNSYQLSCQY